MSFSLADVLKKQCNKLDELKMAAEFVLHSSAIKEELSQAQVEVTSISKGVESMKHNLEIMKEQNVELTNLLESLKILEAGIIHMQENLPAKYLQERPQLNDEPSPSPTNSDTESVERPYGTDLSRRTKTNPKVTESLVKDCKKTLFKNAEDSYSMELLGAGEFANIPKYIIGRQTLAHLNEFVTTINQILTAKYALLALGKNGARKKGKLDLYLSLKREEIVVGPGEDPIYFFTAEDYQRHTESKLDKSKLNLLTALRHCKRLRELRVGKCLQYVVISASENNRA